MSQTSAAKHGTTAPTRRPAGSKHGITGKGLKGGQLGLLAVVVLGISTIAPAYTLTSSLGPAVNEAVGLQLPAIFIVGFIPMILVSFAYRELNADSPDSGTTFTWATKAFGPFVGWMGGWGLLAANIIVLSNLAGVAVDFFYLFLAQVSSTPELADLTSNKPAQHRHLLRVRGAGRLGQLPRPARHQARAVRPGRLPGAGPGPLRRHGLRHAAPATRAPPSRSAGTGSTPTKIETFGQFTAGMSLAIFVYWGWDVCLTVNEETKNGKKTAGLAGTTDGGRRPGPLPARHRGHHDVRRRRRPTASA